MSARDLSTVLPQFDGLDTGESKAKLWLGRFEKISRLRKWKDDEKAIQFSLHLIGSAEKWYFSLDINTQDSYPELIVKFKERFFPCELSRPRQVRDFLSSSQGNQNIRQYIEGVQAKGLELGKEEQEVQDVILNGLNEDVRNFILAKEPKNVSEITKYGLMYQSFNTSNSLASQISNLQKEVNAMRDAQVTIAGVSREKNQEDRPSTSRPRKRTRPTDACRHCGEYRHFSTDCRFKKVQCFNCRKYGHIKAVCRATPADNKYQSTY